MAIEDAIELVKRWDRNYVQGKVFVSDLLDMLQALAKPSEGNTPINLGNGCFQCPHCFGVLKDVYLYGMNPKQIGEIRDFAIMKGWKPTEKSSEVIFYHTGEMKFKPGGEKPIIDNFNEGEFEGDQYKKKYSQKDLDYILESISSYETKSFQFIDIIQTLVRAKELKERV